MTTFGIRALIALTILAAGLSGCSQEGTLVIKNSASTEFAGLVDGTQVTIDTPGSYETTVYIGKSLAVIGPDAISVVVAGSATTKRPFSEEVTVKSGETTTYLLTDDTGAIIFTNMYLGEVNEINIRPCGGGAFGPDLLGLRKTVPPGSTATIQFEEGCWDIQINYSRDKILEVVTGVQVDIGQIIEIEWTPGYIYPPPVPSATAR